MLFFHALLLFLLSISAMGTARIRTIPTLPKPTLKLVQGPIPQSVRDKQDFEAYRGLWKTVSIPFSISPRMNLTYPQGTGDQSIMIFLDPVLQGVRKMYPESMDDDELKSVFTQPNTWQFVPYEEAQVCNPLRFETMHLTKFL